MVFGGVNTVRGGRLAADLHLRGPIWKLPSGYVRYLRQNPGHGLSLPASPVYLHDLRSCRNPQHDVSHRGHVGYYPGIWSQLGHLPSFRSELLNALRECSNERCCTIAFQCTAGRHRSVAAAMLLERLIWVRFPLCNVEVQHLHEDRWAESTCCASCNSCWITRNRAPNEQLRVLVQNLLEEFDREAYMCAALQRVSPERCPSINTSTLLNIDGHVSSDHTDCESHKSCCPNLQKLHGGMEGYVDWQLFQAISPISVHHEDDISPFHERGSTSDHSSPHDWIGAQHYSPPFSEPSARSSFAKTIADKIIDTESSGFTLTQTWTQRSTQQKPQQKRKRECSSGDSDGFDSIEQKHYMEQNLRHQIQNSQHSPTRSDSMQRSHNCQTASVATSEVPRSCYSPPRSLDLRCSRTRDSDEWANSLFDFFDNQQHPTLQWNSQDASSLYFQRSNESEASSILRFLQMQGPYPGWEYDEFLGEGFDPTPPPSARDDIVLPIIRSGNSTTSQSSSDRAAPPADSWYSQIDVLNHAPESPFWNNRSIDSDGILRDSIDRNHRFVDEALPSLTPESQQVPTPLRWRWYRSPIAGDGDDEDTQTSRRTLESIFDEVHGENAYITISPIRRRTTSDSLQGGGNDDFQPSKADISKLVQKLKCVQHGFQPKQIRMLLVSDHKFLRKIERTTDSKQLQDCVKAAAQRMGLTLPNPSTTNGKELQQNKRSPNNALPATSSQQAQKEEAPARGWQDKGKGKGNAPQQFKAKGKGKEKGKGKGKGKENPEIHLPAPNSSIPTQSGKAKGKGKHDLPPRSFQLAPEGWNVLPLPEFSSTQGGIYMCEKWSKLSVLRSLELGNPFPLVFYLPILWTLESKSLRSCMSKLSNKLVVSIIKSPCKPSCTKLHIARQCTAKLRRLSTFKNLCRPNRRFAISPSLMKEPAFRRNLNCSKNEFQLQRSGFSRLLSSAGGLKFWMFGICRSSHLMAITEAIRSLSEYPANRLRTSLPSLARVKSKLMFLEASGTTFSTYGLKLKESP